MDLLITIAQFMLSLCILIILHECGHFFPAKWFKTKVEKFYLFFDPYFSLFSIKKGETEYGIGWLPLGGYVKIAGKTCMAATDHYAWWCNGQLYTRHPSFCNDFMALGRKLYSY